MECLGLRGVKMVSRENIFEIAYQLSEDQGVDFYQTWIVDLLKYFSTDELKDFFDDYARLRDISIDWNTGIIEYDQ
jgi:hypothetical protein